MDAAAARHNGQVVGWASVPPVAIDLKGVQQGPNASLSCGTSCKYSLLLELGGRNDRAKVVGGR